MSKESDVKAEVVSVFPNKLKIAVDDFDSFAMIDAQVEKLKVGSYLEVSDDSSNKLIAIIDSYAIEILPSGERRYIIDANPLGTISNGIFRRGGEALTIPPTKVRPAKTSDIKLIFESSIALKEQFTFSALVQNQAIRIPINGNKFFNKHFAIVGSTGSGKSHTVAKILQEASSAKEGKYDGLNNSHIVIFDIHGEYKSAFPLCNCIDLEQMHIPYWLFNSDELAELFIESSELNSHNQVSQFRYAVTENKKKCNPKISPKDVYYDSPLNFDISEVIRYIKNMNNELINKKGGRVPTDKDGNAINNRIPSYFQKDYEFEKISSDFVNGPYSGDFERFVLRLETTVANPRLDFLFREDKKSSLEETLKQFIGYTNESKSNVTVIDLGGIPFEVISITVSLISRLLFDLGFYYKKFLDGKTSCEVPLLLVYEEAHKYVPKSDLAKYSASKNAIERIAKEGRKYGITLGIISQRPSEISETIFSQCNNFIAMRLTNPEDQNYVKRLLPDSLGTLTDAIPSLQAGEALVIGDAISLPSLVKIDECNKNAPSSNDIKYYDIWKEQWKDVIFQKILEKWK